MEEEEMVKEEEEGEKYKVEEEEGGREVYYMYIMSKLYLELFFITWTMLDQLTGGNTYKRINSNFQFLSRLPYMEK